jgi:hypothetical protein
MRAIQINHAQNLVAKKLTSATKFLQEWMKQLDVIHTNGRIDHHKRNQYLGDLRPTASNASRGGMEVTRWDGIWCRESLCIAITQHESRAVEEHGVETA